MHKLTGVKSKVKKSQDLVYHTNFQIFSYRNKNDLAKEKWSIRQVNFLSESSSIHGPSK